MIVARQRQYYQTIPGEAQRPDIKKRKPIRKKRVGIRRRALIRVCVILAIGILVISRFAVISEHNFRIRAMEKELAELHKENERLQLQRARVMDINRLEHYALHQLGMIYPDSRDIIYVAVEKSKEDLLYAKEPEEAQKAGILDNRLFSFLTNTINKIFKRP